MSSPTLHIHSVVMILNELQAGAADVPDQQAAAQTAKDILLQFDGNNFANCNINRLNVFTLLSQAGGADVPNQQAAAQGGHPAAV